MDTDSKNNKEQGDLAKLEVFLKRRWKIVLAVFFIFWIVSISLAGRLGQVNRINTFLESENIDKKEDNKIESVKEQEEEVAQKQSEPELVQDKSTSQQYKFIDSKTEKSGKIESVMDLYSFSEEINLDDLKNFLKEKKDSFKGGDFYYLVIFNDSINAKFPDSPFSSQYGIEEEKQKNIKAIYKYNKLNGYSELTYYKENMWESEPNTAEI